MANHVSATARNHTPHITGTSISNALKRRAESVIKDRSIDAETRAIIRYGLETNDPWLAELVRRVDAGEAIIDNINVQQTSEEKIKALTEMICNAGDEPSAALFVLMATLQNATDPKALSNLAKHLAFTHCGELNVYGIVDAQIAVIEGELLASNTPIS